MLRQRSTHRRAGFTMIEMLVVVTIIAILVSMLVAVVTKALGVGPKAETNARITVVGNAIGTFKANQSFGQVNYIPAGRLDTTTSPPTWQPFRLRNSYPATPAAGEPGQYDFEAQYLVQVFGSRVNLANLGNPGLDVTKPNLDANQTLTFFLTGIPVVNGSDVLFTGFSTNPQAPFTSATNSPGEVRRGPVLDLSGKGKYVVDSSGFARIVDGFGNPLAYFTSYDGKTNKFYGGYGNDQLVNTKFAPQKLGNVVAYSRNKQFENPSGFQIISAGKDGLFGDTGDWNSIPKYGEDDQASFTDRLLGAGPR
jgi:prepilin-type N-terminal cleavage/methylation domain-containing protein